MKALLDLMRSEFGDLEQRDKGGQEITESLQNLSRLLSATFHGLYECYSPEQRKKLCGQLATVSGQSARFVVHVQTLLVSECINCQVVDSELWQVVTSGQSLSRSVILCLYSYIMSLYAVCVARILLEFDPGQFKTAVTDVSKKAEWTLTQSHLTGELPNWSSPIQFFMGHRKELVLPEILSEKLMSSVKLQNLSVMKWNLEKTLENVRSVRDAFDWTAVTETEDLQYRTYLVCASFMYPLVELCEVFPDTFAYDKGFLAGEFLPWLRKCVGPSVQNNAVVHALCLMGEIICKESGRVLSVF